MNALELIDNPQFRRDLSRAQEELRKRGGKGTLAPTLDYIDGEVAGVRFVITTNKTFYSSVERLAPPSRTAIASSSGISRLEVAPE